MLRKSKKQHHKDPKTNKEKKSPPHQEMALKHRDRLDDRYEPKELDRVLAQELLHTDALGMNSHCAPAFFPAFSAGGVIRVIEGVRTG